MSSRVKRVHSTTRSPFRYIAVNSDFSRQTIDSDTLDVGGIHCKVWNCRICSSPVARQPQLRPPTRIWFPKDLRRMSRSKGWEEGEWRRTRPHGTDWLVRSWPSARHDKASKHLQNAMVDYDSHLQSKGQHQGSTRSSMKMLPWATKMLSGSEFLDQNTPAAFLCLFKEELKRRCNCIECMTARINVMGPKDCPCSWIVYKDLKL